MPVALMCHILSHTPQVHNQKYQAKHLRHDMQSAAFGELAGDNKQLFKNIGQAGKDYDPKAPVYMTVEQHHEAESRQDTTRLKRQLEELKAQGRPDEARTLRNKLTNHMRQLEKLAILARREDYFRDRANRLERGTLRYPPPTPPQNPANNDWIGARDRVKIDHKRLRVDDLMRAWAPATVFDAAAETRALYAMDWLGNYLCQSTSAIAHTTESMPALAEVLDHYGLRPSLEEENGDDDDKDPLHERPGRARLVIPPGKQAKCLICSKSFSKRSNLTKHAMVHLPALARDFACPVCGTVTTSPPGFSNHVERAHGKEYAPAFNASLGPDMVAAPAAATPPVPQLSCGACHCLVRADAILRHFNTCHVAAAPPRPAQALRLDCLDCADVHGLRPDAWFDHLTAKHEFPPVEPCPFCDCFFQRQGLPPHIRRCHFDAALGPRSCPICLPLDGIEVPLPDYPAWRVHAVAAGHRTEPWTTALGTKRPAPIATSLAGADHTSADPPAKRPCYEPPPELNSSFLYQDEAPVVSPGSGRDLHRLRTSATPAPLQAGPQSCLSISLSPAPEIAGDRSSPAATADDNHLTVSIDPALWQEWQAHQRPAKLCYTQPAGPSSIEPCSDRSRLSAEEPPVVSPLSSLAGSTVCDSPVIATTADEQPCPLVMDCIVVAPGPTATPPPAPPTATSKARYDPGRPTQRHSRHPGQQVLSGGAGAMEASDGVRRSHRLRKR